MPLVIHTAPPHTSGADLLSGPGPGGGIGILHSGGSFAAQFEVLAGVVEPPS